MTKMSTWTSAGVNAVTSTLVQGYCSSGISKAAVSGLGSNNYEGVRPVVNVRMSPQFTKEFTQLLQNSIKMFEEKFGEIKVFKPEEN